MNVRVFPAELRTASNVPRWSIVWTLADDFVSNHSFFVTFYSHQIARLIGWRPDDGALGDLMYVAMVHDLDETITGDIVSPVKRAIVDNDRAAEYIDAKMEERLATVVHSLNEIEDRGEERLREIERIVKAADRLDALLYLTIERRLGNGVITQRLVEMWNMMEAAWMALPAPKELLQQSWNTVLVPAVKDHETTGGFGV